MSKQEQANYDYIKELLKECLGPVELLRMQFLQRADEPDLFEMRLLLEQLSMKVKAVVNN